MKRVLIIFLLAFSSCCQAAQIPVSEDNYVTITVNKLTNSKRIPKTYELKASVSENFVVNGTVIARIGNPAVIKISDYSKAKSFGRGGSIIVDGAVFYDNSGNPHNVLIKEKFIQENDIWLTRIIPFNKGKQAQITPAHNFRCQIATHFNYNTDAPRVNFKEGKNKK